MSLVPLLLSFNIVKLFFSAWNLEESLVFIRLNVPLLVSLVQFTFSLLLELVS